MRLEYRISGRDRSMKSILGLMAKGLNVRNQDQGHDRRHRKSGGVKTLHNFW